jgi:hypothetical protein
MSDRSARGRPPALRLTGINRDRQRVDDKPGNGAGGDFLLADTWQ